MGVPLCSPFRGALGVLLHSPLGILLCLGFHIISCCTLGVLLYSTPLMVPLLLPLQLAGLRSSNERFEAHIQSLEAEQRHQGGNPQLRSPNQQGALNQGALGHHPQIDLDNPQQGGLDSPHAQQGNLPNPQSPWLNRDHANPSYHDNRDSNPQQGHPQQSNNAGAGLDGGGGAPAADNTHHMSDQEKRTIYEGLRDRVRRGQHLSEKQAQAYELLSRQYGGPALRNRGEGAGQRQPLDGAREEHHIPRQDGEHQEVGGVNRNPSRAAQPQPVAGIQQPPSIRGHGDSEQRKEPPGPRGVANNEQEEVKDLVDGGQQKVGVFDNVKERRGEDGAEGGAGGPNVEDSDEEVELRDGGRNVDPLNRGDEDGGPLPNPIGGGAPLEGDGGRKRARKGVDTEDDDVGDYGAVEHVGRNHGGGNHDQVRSSQSP